MHYYYSSLECLRAQYIIHLFFPKHIQLRYNFKFTERQKAKSLFFHSSENWNNRCDFKYLAPEYHQQDEGLGGANTVSPLKTIKNNKKKTACCCCLAIKLCTTLLQPHGLYPARPLCLSVGFPRQEYWNALPFPSPGDLPDRHLLH